jgi:hypothetical protein
MKPNFNGRRARLLAGLAVTAALFVPLTVFGGSALARSTAAASEYQYSGSSQYQYRVQICHRTGSKKHPFHTITVSSKAVAAHVRHGDHVGPCTGTETVKPKHHSGSANGSSAAPTTPGSNGKGHSDGHGKGHGK